MKHDYEDFVSMGVGLLAALILMAVIVAAAAIMKGVF